MLNEGNRSQTPNKPKLLLIQQHLPTAMSLVALLTQGGCDLKVATDGKGALQMAQDFGFDLIALDPDLQDGNGFETFLRLRQIPALSTIPIVFIARRFDDASWRRGLELGAADYIEKPFDGPAFVRRILSHIKTRPAFIKIT
jgi:putative two-component system response regulator